MRPRYHVFLSHNSADKPAVEEIARKLREEGIEPFLDKWHLIAGEPWQEALEEALEQSATCAVFLGPSGIGPWQNEEMRVVLSQRPRDRGSRVIPVLLPRAPLPKKKEVPLFLTRLTWVDFRTGLDNEDAIRQLVAGIRRETPGPNKGDRSSIYDYRSMAIPPDGFVHRREYDWVVDALCPDNLDNLVRINVALIGAGGFGKTALAQAVCQDERVRKKYPDGVLWATMGEEISESGRLSRMRDLIRWWTGTESPVFETIDSASAFLRNIIKRYRILLVIDDSWSDLDIIPFHGMCSATLITTRKKGITPIGERVAVDAMDIPEAVNLLQAGLPKEGIVFFNSLAIRLGKWPILLKLVNRQLREMVREDGVSVLEALLDVESILESKGMTAFDQDNAESRQSAVEKTLAVSLRRLNDLELDRYRDLVVFPKDVEIPISILERFWKSSRAETEKICQRIDNLSLLLHYDRRKGFIQLHDVFLQYLTHRPGESLPNLHRRLLDALRPMNGLWKDLPNDEKYLWKYLGYHLLESGEKIILRDLLIDFYFIQAKIMATDINMLITDYDLFVKEDEELWLIQGALRLSAHILVKHPEQLAPHLLGRLLGGETIGLKRLLEQCRKASRFRPRAPSFRPPGPLLRTIELSSYVDTLSAVDGRRVVSRSIDGILKIWDLETGQHFRTLEGHNPSIKAMAVVVDGRRIVSGFSDGTLQSWDWETGQTLQILEEPNSLVRAVAMVDDQHVISGSSDGMLRIGNLETGQIPQTLIGHSASINTVATVDGLRAVSGSLDGTLRIWNLKTGKALVTLEGHSAPVNAVAVVGGQFVVSASNDTTLRIWDLETGQTLRTLKGHMASVNAVAVVDGQRVVSASNDATLRIWDLETGKTLQILEAHSDWVRAVAVIDGHRIVSSSDDSTLRVWDLETRQTLRSLERHDTGIRAVAVVDDLRAVSGSEDGMLRTWGLKNGQTLRTFESKDESFSTLDIINSQCAVSGSDKMLRVWNLETGETLQRLEGHKSWVTAVAVVGSQRIISASHDRTLRVWELKTGETLRTLEGHTAEVSAVAVVGSHRIVSGSHDQTLRVWELETGEALGTLKGHTAGVNAVAEVDDQQAISCSRDRTLRVWDLESGSIRQILQANAAGVNNSKGELDGQQFISGSRDRALPVWSLESGDIRQTLEENTAGVITVAVVDGRWAVSGSYDRTLRVWDLKTGDCLAVLVLEATVISVAIAPDRQTVVAGDSSGRVHFLDLDVDALN